MPPKRMTANPQKPARYRPGRPTTEEALSTSDSDSDSNADAPPDTAPKPAPPKASSFPASTTTKIASTLKQVDLNSIRRRAALDEEARVEAEKAARAKREEEEGFVTEEEDGDSGSEAGGSDDGEEGTGSEDEEDSSGDSDEEAPKVLLRPTFIRKDQRKDPNPTTTTTDPSQSAAEQHPTTDTDHRLAQADALIEAQLEKNAAALAAGKKHWDDDDDASADHIDDTDALDPPSELAAWKLRELLRVKRARTAIETAERERDEVERRRGLGPEEREAEDRVFLAGQREEREGRGKMGYLQKYHHKGAFFQEDARELGLGGRDVMGGRFVDEVRDRELLPRYLQVRDMARVGRKGASKYRDLKSEDTGRWGEVGKGGGGVGGVRDERFMPDGRDGGRGGGASGANAMAVKERRRAPEGGPEGPRADRNGSNGRDGGDTYRPGHDRTSDDDEPRRRSPRRRSPSRSRSRSPSPRREQHRDHRDRRKRSPSPYRTNHAGDKRRKVDVS